MCYHFSLFQLEGEVSFSLYFESSLIPEQTFLKNFCQIAIQLSRVITIIFTTETSTSDGISLGTDLF